MGTAKDNAAYRFAEMPEVDGAMIVESGSNSWGKWTRWADGTQVCRATYVDRTAPPTWTYPLEFLELPTISFSFNRSSASGTGVVSNPSHNGNVTRVQLEGYGLILSQAETLVAVHYIATGRWK